MLTLTGRLLFTTIVILLLVTVTGDAHVALEVRTTDTTSPFAKAVVVNVALLVPAFVPFTVHWYDGVVPPFTGLAVNVTDVPEQIVALEAEILTVGVTTLFTVMVIVL